MSRGAEFAGVVAVFFVVGFLLDLWLDTTPWFMIGLFLFAAVGQFVKFWYTYDDQMKTLEQERAERAKSSHGRNGESVR